jgi:DNA-binding NtrC family response regulator
MGRVFQKEALDMLMNYHWKGNVRESGNAIERVVILCDGNIIIPEYFILGKQSILDSVKSV